MATASADHGAYADELRRRARSSGQLVAVVALVLLPAWGGFDRLLEPAYARAFITVRLAGELPMLALAFLLWYRPVGHRRPELLTVAILAVVQGEIAWMLVRADSAREFYLLGFSLALYASGVIMGGRPAWTGAVAAATWLALGVALLTAPDRLTGREVAATAFYLTTASIIGLLGHLRRDRLTARERVARTRLEREQLRSRELLAQLEHLSYTEPLTGLANRRRWDEELARACSRARRDGSQLAVVLIDVDRFKDVNDRCGHTGGDDMLRAVAALLTRRVRGGDLVARVGGDEFAVLLVGTDAVSGTELAEDLRLEASVLRTSDVVPASLSLGVAGVAGHDALPDVVMAAADVQLYRAKASRNAVAAPHLTAL